MSTITNPILPGFNPDPSICFVDGMYYIATSTFEWFPGVQIHASKDLTNWELVKRPLDTVDKLDMKGNPSSAGVWAPCLSHDGEKFYLIFTNVRSWDRNTHDALNYVTTCYTIDGEWKKPVLLNTAGFDPSLFHDPVSGKKYYICMESDFRSQRDMKKLFNGIIMQEFDPNTNKLVGPIKKIYQTSTDKDGLGLTEGSHLSYRNGYYYIWCAEGGTVYTHTEIVARSKNIEGPYEDHPMTPFITARAHSDLPIQKSGHGQICENDKGESYFVHLCGRPLGEGKTNLSNDATELDTDVENRRCILGRETAIQKVEWREDWPYVVNGRGDNTPAHVVEVPGDAIQVYEVRKEYTFNTDDFKRDFQSLRIPLGDDIMNIVENKGHLRLYGRESWVSKFEQALIARRQTHFKFTAQTKLKCNSDGFKRLAGLNYRYNEDNQFFANVYYDQYVDKHFASLIKVQNGVSEHLSVEIEYKGEITFKVESDHGKAKFYYSLDGANFTQLGPEFDCTFLSDEGANPLGFTGAFVGIAAVDMQSRGFFADFEYFNYENHYE